MERLNKILMIIALSLFVLIATISLVYVATQKKASGGARSVINDPPPAQIESLNKRSKERQAAYTGLGTIRTITAVDTSIEGDAGTVTVITPWLSYPEGDTVFFEELSRKRILLLGEITDYFSARTKNELLSMPEEKIKGELTEGINSQLSLGKISAIYFTDYIFLE